MAGEVPAGFIVLSRKEALVALAACRSAAERDRSRPLRDLTDDLHRLLMSAHGHVAPAGADMDASSGGVHEGEVPIEVVAAALHCSDRHARRFCPPDGPLRGRKVGRGDWMIERDSLDELIEERRRTA